MPPRLVSLRDKRPAQAATPTTTTSANAAATGTAGTSEGGPSDAPPSSSSSSATNPTTSTTTLSQKPKTKPSVAFKPNSASVAKAKTTKIESDDSDRRAREPREQRPKRVFQPRPDIMSQMMPSNLAGNHLRVSGSKSALGGRTSGGGGAGDRQSAYGYDATDKIKSDPGFGFSDVKDDLNLDERDLVMMQNSFDVQDEDAPISLGWSRRVRDREHFLANKKKSDVKADIMIDDREDTTPPENETQSFDEFVQAEQKQLFFFQLPKKLPHFEGLEHSLLGTNEPDANGDLDMTSKSEGLIGKILVHRSGKMKLVLGNISMDVDVVPYSDCIQEAMAIDTTNKTCCILGRVSKRFICTPDINDLLSP
ncbi:hypothetical protein BCR33DRAFT_789941 [Rhizoclosmatium globosum]|uniref:RNA polymerase III RPC4-domain-containing protein n=1 Tax=Rhizoclosmatium globosum TaxID=329046 RepID=A0A1Y2BQQ3_9FUNG|nr:hypothetical protein BCR33DRAFT_789941 [Rhizoclosmatium globosum]|eukprot:ORY37082.1 hypothetical protein BCR33DRAFT_789941 [Rhizoclosmatium globosum]